MIFNFSKWMMNPLVLMIFAVLTGMLLGKIRIGKFCFGVSGALFTGLILGWAVVKYAAHLPETSDNYGLARQFISSSVIPKNFMNLFLVLFVASVGLLASKEIGTVLKKYGGKFVILGILITFIGAATTYGMTLLTTKIFKSNSTPYEVSGVYTGALTSSPGLAAATETAATHASKLIDQYETASLSKKQIILNMINTELKAEKSPRLTKEQKIEFIKNAEASIGIGHAIGYPFGVIIVIIAVNFFPAIFHINLDKEKEIFREEMKHAKKLSDDKNIQETNFDLISFCLAMFLGYSLGKIGLSLKFFGIDQNFSLGSTGGVLIGSLVLGYIGKIGPLNFRMDSKILGIIRQISLAFFLAIVGLRYGSHVFDAIVSSGLVLAIVGLIVGLTAMLCGFFVGHYVLKINWIMLAGAICGGMTSTPGLGAVIDAVKSDDPAAGYGATYPFALLGMVIFTIVLHLLPI